MKHAENEIYPLLGLAAFVLCVVVFSYFSETLEQARVERLTACLVRGESKFICGFKATFGVTHYEN